MLSRVCTIPFIFSVLHVKYQSSKPIISGRYPVRASAAIGLGLWLLTANGGNPVADDSIAQQTSIPTSSQHIIDETLLDSQRELYIEAEQALKSNRPEQFKRLLEQLRNYPLYSYLQYKYYRARLHHLEDTQIQEFLARNDNTVIGERFRYDVLKHFARKQQWASLVRYYQPQASTSLQCYYLMALLETGQQQQALAQVEPLWTVGHSQPKSCNALFDTWEQAGFRSDELNWKRIELSMARSNISLARYLAKALPAADQKLVEQWINIHRNPELVTRLRINQQNHVREYGIVLHAIKRQSRKNPEDAARLWRKLEQKYAFEDSERYPIYRYIGLALARQHYAEADYWLNQIPEQFTDDLVRQWKLRSTIRHGQWPELIDTIESLPPKQQAEFAWQFWWAYANEKLGNAVEAEGIYRYLAEHRHYYGFLAADRLELPYAFEDKPLEISQEELASLSQYPEAQRARELYKLDKILDARREWYQLTETLSTRQKLAAARLAQQWDWHDRAIVTMGQTDYRDDIALRFPMPMKDKVEHYSEKQQIDPALTYAVIRRESAFMADARSSVGALGLMQIMPGTARRVARHMNLPYGGKYSLLSADINLNLGTSYLGQMLKRLDSQPVLATAAYNAGPNRVIEWLPQDEPLEAIRWIETIPFTETREYVSNVLTYSVIYQHRMAQAYTRLTQNMPPVQPRNSQTQTAALQKVVRKRGT